jgi:hypothetical protein
MKTCTVTWFRGKNYGAFLQAFALQKILGNENTLLDMPLDLYVSRIRNLPKICWIPWALMRKYIFLSPFKEISKLQKSKSFATLKQLFSNPPKADAFVVGSDQVWGVAAVVDKEPYYYLDFVPESARRISYAPSLGRKSWPKEYEIKVLPILRKFYAISVREESSAEYLRSLGLNAVCVCDPTILHTADFYRKEFYNPSMEPHPSDPFTFIYRLREELSEDLIYKLKNKKLLWQDMHQRKRIPVAEWLWNIDHASLVVTDSFHAVVFCLLFHTPFEVILNQGAHKGMNERFSTLLGKAGLPLAPNPAEIDWESVDTKLAEWREYSKTWLMNALEGAA